MSDATSDHPPLLTYDRVEGMESTLDPYSPQQTLLLGTLQHPVGPSLSDPFSTWSVAPPDGFSAS